LQTLPRLFSRQNSTDLILWLFYLRTDVNVFFLIFASLMREKLAFFIHCFHKYFN
jgi:hypothetical protein